MEKFLDFGKIKYDMNLYMGKESYEIIRICCPNNRISKNQEHKLISIITEGYYSTSQSIDEFACEYYSVVDMILSHGYIPLELEYLAIEKIYDDIINILKS